MRNSLYDDCQDGPHAALLREWDSGRNTPLTPAEVTHGSHRKVWWVCAAGHHWQAAVYARYGGSGCPYCAKRRRMPPESAQNTVSQLPQLAKEWDAERNKTTPDQITTGSHRMIWWRCAKGHSYRAAVNARVRGSGCPYCAGRAVLRGENSLAAQYPALLREWDWENNGTLSPADVLAGTRRKVWWKCPKGHSWQAAVVSRTNGGTGCPICAGKLVIPGENDLKTHYPMLAKQWDTEKNGALTPQQVTSASNRRVWWRCEQGHSYAAVIAHRTQNGSDCPYCTGRKVLAGFNDLQTAAPDVACQWHPTLNGTLTPQQVTAGSRKKVWWQCAEGHVWKAAVYSRTGTQKCGCPVCAGRVNAEKAQRYRKMQAEQRLKL